MQALKPDKSRIAKSALRELCDPRVRNARPCTNFRPTAPALDQSRQRSQHQIWRRCCHAKKITIMLVELQGAAYPPPGKGWRHAARMKKATSRDIIAANISRLLLVGAELGLPKSQNALAKKSGVAQTTLSNWLDPTKKVYPQVDKLEAVAQVYGLEAWQLLVPGISWDLASRLKKLVTNYKDCAPRTREYIDRLAEADADFQRPSPE